MKLLGICCLLLLSWNVMGEAEEQAANAWHATATSLAGSTQLFTAASTFVGDSVVGGGAQARRRLSSACPSGCSGLLQSAGNFGVLASSAITNSGEGS